MYLQTRRVCKRAAVVSFSMHMSSWGTERHRSSVVCYTKTCPGGWECRRRLKVPVRSAYGLRTQFTTRWRRKQSVKKYTKSKTTNWIQNPSQLHTDHRNILDNRLKSSWLFEHENMDLFLHFTSRLLLLKISLISLLYMGIALHLVFALVGRRWKSKIISFGTFTHSIQTISMRNTPKHAWRLFGCCA